jgi:folate-binding protein YgfZ
MDRSSRTRLRVHGRAPEQVLAGLVSGKLPSPLAPSPSGAWTGRAEGSTLLTAKGRMIAELRLLRAGPAPEDGFLIDLPEECREGALAHLRKFVPPRLAAISDETEATGMLTVLGPNAAGWLSEKLFGERLDAEQLRSLAEGDLLHDAQSGGGVSVIRTAEVAVDAFDVLGSRAVVGSLSTALSEDAARPLSAGDWTTLRLEAGRPAYGADLDETTIPVEAGIHARTVDYQKGCFTGQEVLIRIRDRGHVNRLLRGLRMGQIGLPERGTSLFREADERAVGAVTSAAYSPSLGEVIGLGYLRREVEPATLLRLGSSTGEPVRVFDLDREWKPRV